MKNQLLTSEQSIEKLINDSIVFLEKGYLSNKKKFKIQEISKELTSFSYEEGIRLLHLTKIVYEEKENILEKLSNVFTALYSNNATLFLILDSNGEKCDFYLGVRDEKKISQSFLTLKSSLSGNFPGAEYNSEIETKDIEYLMNEITNDKVNEISIATGIPSSKIEYDQEFIPGIEKVIVGMEGKSFSAIFLASPINYEVIKEIKKGYEDLYTGLYPYLNTTISLTKNEAISFSKSFSENITKSYSKNLSKTENINNSKAKTKNGADSIGLGFLLSINHNKSIGNSKTIGSGESNTSGEVYGEIKGDTQTKTIGKNDSTGKTVQLAYKNRSLESIINKLDKHIKRIEAAEGNGFWNVAAYFMSREQQNSVIAANLYSGITTGKESGLERNSICTFREPESLETIKDYLYNFETLKLNVEIGKETVSVALGSQITNEELALKINLPQKSLTGLDVIKMASFGRNPMATNSYGIDVGKIYHLGKKYKTNVLLNLESLTSHTFITGSTGSGKSNTVYTLLDEVYKKGIKFLVIEPAKGEYKNVFGGRPDVKVYGTNEEYTELLKINPFSFNKNIHIFEHIDRLIEIFNACWPLYAAMPAILKEAIIKAYEIVGWDLENSKNLYGRRIFPSMKHLKMSLIEVISQSNYSEENKSNYIGALVTRVNSLDNGIIGKLFSEEELEDRKLFDENVIIDISRIASGETKSLLMGILFIKLQEHRMANSKGDNSDLQHVTVLEEAHHLLKRISVNQGIENNNLQGKSIEMLTNAIAEMRTYGEGFIIVDQAPELLDGSAIRNTNTKICLRLPSLVDREIVGHSMNLNDDQIEELAKLDVGVAAIIQTSWKEPCLVKINYMSKIDKYKYDSNKKFHRADKSGLKSLLFARLPESEKIGIKCNEEIEKLNDVELDERIYKEVNGDKILRVALAAPFSDMDELYLRISDMLKVLLNLENTDKLLELEIINSMMRVLAVKDPESVNLYSEWKILLKEGGIL